MPRLARFAKSVHRLPEILVCRQQTDSWLELTLAYLRIKDLNYPYIFKNKKGYQIRLESFHDLVTVWIIFFRKEYSPKKSPKILIDAGANIGTFSIYALSTWQVDRIYAFEPFPQTLEKLKSNVSQNSGKEKVTIEPFALAGSSGQRPMDLSTGPSQSRGILGPNDSRQSVSVASTSLSDFFKQENISEIDFMKMDIEGSEHDVLLNTDPEILGRMKEIALEYHPTHSKQPLFEKLISSGFKLSHDHAVGPNSGVAHFVRL